MSAREFYEEARARVGEIIAACEKDAPPSPPRKHGRYAVLPFAVASVALTIAALAFAAIRVSEHEEVTAIAAFVMAFTLPLCAGMRVLRVSRQTATDGSSVLEDARSLKRGLDSALACYDTDSGLGEYNNLHGFRKRLAEVEAAYLAELY